MNPDFWLELVMRWMHIFAAVTAVGGLIYVRFALLPAAEQLDDDTRRKLNEGIRARWSKVVAGAILFLLVSGFVNFFRHVRDFELEPLYHPLFGVKFLLALAVFFIASVMNGRSSMAERFRQNARFWVNLNLALAAIVIALSGVLKVLEKNPKSPSPTAAASHVVAVSGHVQAASPWESNPFADRDTDTFG